MGKNKIIAAQFLQPQNDVQIALLSSQDSIALPNVVPSAAQSQLIRMFRDPNVLDKPERTELIRQLREAVSLHAAVPELRVLLGMALCVDLDIQPAMEELRQAVHIGPDNFLARLKFGELLMRLRICQMAAEETHQAALLASNPIQAELARRQAATIRTMLREGVERGGYGGLFAKPMRALKKLNLSHRRARQDQSTALAGPV